MDPIQRLAALRFARIYADLELQFSTRAGGQPVLAILKLAQERAAESLAALAFVDARNVNDILTLQNEVKRYDEFIGWVRELVQQGKIAESQITEEEREEILDIVLAQPEGQPAAVETGLIESSHYDA